MRRQSPGATAGRAAPRTGCPPRGCGRVRRLENAAAASADVVHRARPDLRLQRRGSAAAAVRPAARRQLDPGRARAIGRGPDRDNRPEHDASLVRSVARLCAPDSLRDGERRRSGLTRASGWASPSTTVWTCHRSRRPSRPSRPRTRRSPTSSLSTQASPRHGRSGPNRRRHPRPDRHLRPQADLRLQGDQGQEEFRGPRTGRQFGLAVRNAGRPRVRVARGFGCGWPERTSPARARSAGRRKACRQDRIGMWVMVGVGRPR